MKHLTAILCQERFEDLLFLAIAFVAFYGLARLGESIQTSQAASLNTLFMDNIIIHDDSNPPCILIYLLLVKIRNSAFPDILIIHQSFDNLSLFKIILNYISYRISLHLTHDSGYLFCHKDGSLATKRWFLNKLNSLFPEKHLAGHGFRAGGTTELILRGLLPHIVQMIGRWSSDTFEEYIRRHPLVMNAYLASSYNYSSRGSVPTHHLIRSCSAHELFIWIIQANWIIILFAYI